MAFIAAPNFEAPTDVGANNAYDVIVSASDGTLTDTPTIAVTVINASEVPVISSDGGGATATCSCAENTIAVTTSSPAILTLTEASGFSGGYSV